MIKHETIIATILVAISSFACATVSGQNFYQAPINYDTAKVTDRVFQLKTNLESGKIKLDWDDNTGWLASLLKHLDIDTSSQMLVFSKTSLQIRKISPTNPRALFFNDDAYVGYVPGGELIELSAVDKNQGAIFYSIKTSKVDVPTISRDYNNCMTCHGTTRTQRVPGYLVRSVYPRANGQPAYGLGTITVDHRTKFHDRFGGWYATGNHGEMTHRGNSFFSGKTLPKNLANAQNAQQLPDRIRLNNYPTNTSDLVAIMVLEHQSQMHNFITQAAYETRQALHYQGVMNRALSREANFLSDSTKRRVASAGDKLLSYLLFQEEATWTNVVKGNSNFASDFQQRGVVDSTGRSLRKLNLKTRLFEFPCSFLIYSESFDALPPMVLEHVQTRLATVLLGRDESKEFDYLSDQHRNDLLEILSDTKLGFRDLVKQVKADLDKGSR